MNWRGMYLITVFSSILFIPLQWPPSLGALGVSWLDLSADNGKNLKQRCISTTLTVFIVLKSS